MSKTIAVGRQEQFYVVRYTLINGKARFGVASLQATLNESLFHLLDALNDGQFSENLWEIVYIGPAENCDHIHAQIKKYLHGRQE